MKTNYLLLVISAIMMLLFSCGKEELDHQVAEENKSEFKYAKDLIVSDQLGNSAEITVFSDSEQALEDHSAGTFILNVTSENLLANVDLDGEVQDRPEETEEDSSSNLVFVVANKMNFNDNVTGFNLRSRLEFEGDNRASYQYAWGSWGVNGVSVTYVQETCDDEYLKTKLSVKNNALDLTWGSIGSSTLFDEGDSWSTYNGTTFHRYRLKVNARAGCIGSALYSYYWLY